MSEDQDERRVLGAGLLLIRQRFLHDPQSNSLAYQHHLVSRSRISPARRNLEQVSVQDSRRCRLWVVETASAILERCRIKNSNGEDRTDPNIDFLQVFKGDLLFYCCNVHSGSILHRASEAGLLI